MPPSASWNLPMRLSTAPVKAPFSWPNSMLSTRFSGMAPQLTVMKGRALRSLSPWMARAISSLPTPLSPSISTGMLEAAARRPSAMARCMAWPRMMRSAKVSVPSAFFLMRAISPCSASILSALLIDTSRRSGEVGLTTKSAAPARMAAMAASIEPCAVWTMMGGVPGFEANRPNTSVPFMPGMTRSSRTRPTPPRSAPSRIWRACSPPWAVLVS